MKIDELIERLTDEGADLALAADGVDWDRPVPRTDWTLRDLVTHVGGVHRWAADVVRTGATDLDTPLSLAVGQGPPDDELLKWYVDGHSALVTALRNASPDLRAATFLPAPSPRLFWARRQAHETAIHRADAQAASGVLSSFAPDFAQDGISELLQGFAARRQEALQAEGTLHLDCTDGPSWLVSFQGDQISAEVVADADRGDVIGSSSDLYLWLWNRESRVVVDESRPLVGLWSRAVQVTWA